MTLTSRPKSRLRLPPNKHQVKQELAQDVAHFLARGGNVEQVEQGETALVNGCFNQQRPAVVSQAQTRTLLSSEIEAIEKRKEERRHTKPMPVKTNRRPTKKWIYDDFGEPLRWVWA
jgi:hypothetical protein|tara:strand:+ start:4207 stop:4557 length:351 start_codon:yes stop_codon:yes gene_type:complete